MIAPLRSKKIIVTRENAGGKIFSKKIYKKMFLIDKRIQKLKKTKKILNKLSYKKS